MGPSVRWDDGRCRLPDRHPGDSGDPATCVVAVDGRAKSNEAPRRSTPSSQRTLGSIGSFLCFTWTCHRNKMGPSVRWDDGSESWIPAHAGMKAHRVEQAAVARPLQALVIISPHILTALRRNACRRLSTCWSTGGPHPVWTTRTSRRHALVNFSPHILTALRYKAATRLSTRFPKPDPHSVWTSRIVEHAAVPPVGATSVATAGPGRLCSMDDPQK